MRALTIALAASLLASSAFAAGDGIAICSSCPGTTLVSLTGADTAHAKATARVSEADLRNYCEGYRPGDAAEIDRCVAEGWRVETVEAAADCPALELKMDGEVWKKMGGIWMNEAESGYAHGPGQERWYWARANFGLLCPSTELIEGPPDDGS